VNYWAIATFYQEVLVEVMILIVSLSNLFRTCVVYITLNNVCKQVNEFIIRIQMSGIGYQSLWSHISQSFLWSCTKYCIFQSRSAAWFKH